MVFGVIPGSNGSVKGIKDAIKIANEIGYPIMLKAASRAEEEKVYVLLETNQN